MDYTIRVERLTRTLLRTSETSEWVERKIPRIGLVSIHCMSSPHDENLFECWARVGFNGSSEDRKSGRAWDFEYRGVPKRVASLLVSKHLKDSSKTVNAAAGQIFAGQFAGMWNQEIAMKFELPEAVVAKAMQLLKDRGLARTIAERGWFRV